MLFLPFHSSRLDLLHHVWPFHRLPGSVCLRQLCWRICWNSAERGLMQWSVSHYCLSSREMASLCFFHGKVRSNRFWKLPRLAKYLAQNFLSWSLQILSFWELVAREGAALSSKKVILTLRSRRMGWSVMYGTSLTSTWEHQRLWSGGWIGLKHFFWRLKHDMTN